MCVTEQEKLCLFSMWLTLPHSRYSINVCMHSRLAVSGGFLSGAYADMLAVEVLVCSPPKLQQCVDELCTDTMLSS